jgi:hypothetical protein
VPNDNELKNLSNVLSLKWFCGEDSAQGQVPHVSAFCRAISAAGAQRLHYINLGEVCKGNRTFRNLGTSLARGRRSASEMTCHKERGCAGLGAAELRIVKTGGGRTALAINEPDGDGDEGGKPRKAWNPRNEKDTCGVRTTMGLNGSRIRLRRLPGDIIIGTSES